MNKVDPYLQLAFLQLASDEFFSKWQEILAHMEKTIYLDGQVSWRTYEKVLKSVNDPIWAILHPIGRNVCLASKPR